MNEKISKSGAQLLQLPHCERIYDIEGVGEVTFPAGVNIVEKPVNVEIDLGDIESEEIDSMIAACKLAVEAIDDSYDAATAKKIKATFAPFLNYKGAKKIKFSLPFKIILSEDFFGIKFSLIPDLSKFKISYDINKFLLDKLSAIKFLKEHPIVPMAKQQRIIPLDTNKSKAEVLAEIQKQKPSPEIVKKLDEAETVADLIIIARKHGYAPTENFEPLAELEELISDEQYAAKQRDETFDCAETETSISSFRPEEVNEVSTQCCEPIVEIEEEVVFPEITTPDLQSEEEIQDFIDKVNDAAEKMSKCSEEKAYAENYIERIYHIREDLYSTFYYFDTRQKFFTDYKRAISARAELGKIIDENTKMLKSISETLTKYSSTYTTSSTNSAINSVNAKDVWSFDITSVSAVNKIYESLLSPTALAKNLGSTYNIENFKKSVITDLAAIEKSSAAMNTLYSNIASAEQATGFKPGLTDPEKITLKVKNTLGIGADLDLYNPNNLLEPNESSSNPNYSNQSGRRPFNSKSFFLLIDGEREIFNELNTMFKMVKESSTLNIYYKPDHQDYPGAKNATGVSYRKIWDKYNSVDRVDFLFTAAEQGYLTPKPTNAELQDKTNKKIESVKIDNEKASAFLSTYDVQQEARLLQKIAEVRNEGSAYFAKLKASAQADANKIYETQVFAISEGLENIRKNIESELEIATREYRSFKLFDDELDKKLKSLKVFVEEKKACFAKQEEVLKSLYPGDETPTPLESPCSDPYGAKPVKVTNPGPAKNCYWKEYTKNLQSVSFMPIPDILELNKRLFRYYPVGLQIPVPAPPGVLPTLAMGIPDPKISIPFPILWKHILTLTTPAGQFVLWITFCPPFTVAPYLMFLDEQHNAAFLSSAKGKVTIPAPSLKWKKFLEKSLLERIPGLKIPMKALPAIDSGVNNNKPDSMKTYLQELRKQVKAQIDKIDADEKNLSPERIQKRVKLKQYRDKLDKALELSSPDIPKIIVDFIGEIKKQVTDTALQMIDFEPFSIPKTNKKKFGDDVINDALSLKDKVMALKKAGASIQIKTVNVGEIIKRESLAILDTQAGKKIVQEMDAEITKLEAKLRLEKNIDIKIISTERAKVITKSLKKILEKSVKKINVKKLGFIEDPLSLIPTTLPFPCRSDIAIAPIPPWMLIVIAGIQALSSILDSPDVLAKFEKSFSARIDLSKRLPRSQDLLTQAISTGLDIVLGVAGTAIPVPGWPNAIPYPTAPSQIKQIIKEAKNAIFKKKLRLPPLPPGIPPIKITPAMVKAIAEPALNAAIDLTFAIILEEMLKFADEKSEQLDLQTINKIQNTLAIIKAILGTDIWDIREQDIKAAAASFARNGLLTAEKAVEAVMAVADAAPLKELKSIFSKLTMKLEIKLKDGEPALDIGTDIAFALFKTFIMGYVTGKKPALPYPVVLIGCATGLPGWALTTLVNPLSALEKTPPWERLCLKNVPHVLFLDMIAASAQRYGGLGNSYLVPYFIPEP